MQLTAIHVLPHIYCYSPQVVRVLQVLSSQALPGHPKVLRLGDDDTIVHPKPRSTHEDHSPDHKQPPLRHPHEPSKQPQNGQHLAQLHQQQYQSQHPQIQLAQQHPSRYHGEQRPPKRRDTHHLRREKGRHISLQGVLPRVYSLCYACAMDSSRCVCLTWWCLGDFISLGNFN